MVAGWSVSGIPNGSAHKVGLEWCLVGVINREPILCLSRDRLSRTARCHGNYLQLAE